ncbi:hypothetical protein BD311DRAFT_663698 [Dichomitus squalens]|uniref:Uncharacterized protein n=1 Tax=Dichomitus squalens TaxID=114155 RepID=A0A4Q9MLE3_9APHY|nr:hypothetical protein BD311DRAFT_663698 [Dichomitus squalens]TBU57153.1 hypothetical protein BD310DRAFT_570483 [Dichomitus squalens]
MKPAESSVLAFAPILQISTKASQRLIKIISQRRVHGRSVNAEISRGRETRGTMRRLLIPAIEANHVAEPFTAACSSHGPVGPSQVRTKTLATHTGDTAYNGYISS